MSYNEKKQLVRQEAINWQKEAAEISMSYSELAEAQSYFERLGRRYGLLREFHENGIC